MLSTGNGSLDEVIGGGMVVGSLVVLYEDNMSQYYGHLQKTFLGEGIVRSHKCLIVDPEPLRSID
jgi:elongator complex protein 4